MAAPVVHTSDFIDDLSRTGFMGFEGLSPNIVYGLETHSEGGIKIDQISSEPADGILTTFFTPEAERGWYPAGGNFGYSRITLVSGGEFEDVGFLYSTGYPIGETTLRYELFLNGNLVSSDTIPGVPFGSFGAAYLGFSGGGFDEIRLTATRDGNPYPIGDRDDIVNVLALDAIEIRSAAAVVTPEPASLAVWSLLCIGGLVSWRRRNLA